MGPITANPRVKSHFRLSDDQTTICEVRLYNWHSCAVLLGHTTFSVQFPLQHMCGNCSKLQGRTCLSSAYCYCSAHECDCQQLLVLQITPLDMALALAKIQDKDFCNNIPHRIIARQEIVNELKQGRGIASDQVSAFLSPCSQCECDIAYCHHEHMTNSKTCVICSKLQTCLHKFAYCNILHGTAFIHLSVYAALCAPLQVAGSFV